MFDFLLALIEHFSLSITVPSYDAKCVQLGYFHKGVESVDLFAHNFYLDRVLPHQPYFYLVLTQYRSVTDRETDGQTDGYAARSIYSACKASFAARCKKIQLQFVICHFSARR